MALLCFRTPQACARNQPHAMIDLKVRSALQKQSISANRSDENNQAENKDVDPGHFNIALPDRSISSYFQ